MDSLDKKILSLLYKDGRIKIKEIANQVSLTSPAVSERIHRMETTGIIAGYTLRLNPAITRGEIGALISISVAPGERENFHSVLQKQPEVEQCYQVTGTYSHILKVSCKDVEGLEKLISHMQKLGQTNIQIILSTTSGPGPAILEEEDK